jgi:hypothetical protein
VIEMSILNEGSKDEVDVTFSINSMPLQQFKRFKKLSRDWRDNYSVTIQMLMDKNDTLEYIMAGQEPQIEEVELDYEEVKTIGDGYE